MNETLTDNIDPSQVLSQLLRTTLDGFILADLDGNLIDVNPSYCRMVGRSREELLKMNIRQLECAHDDEQVRQRIAEIQKNGGARFQTSHHHRGGYEVDLEVSVTLLTAVKSSPLVAAFVQDVSQQNQLETAFRDSEATMRSIMQGSPDYIFMADVDGNIEFINRTVPDLTIEEVVGKPFFEFVPPESRQTIKDCLNRIRKSLKPDSFEVEYQSKTGERGIFEANIGPILRKNRLIGFSIVSRDVTEQRRLQSRLRHSERLASLGTLAAGITHEIKNPLAAAWTAADAAIAVKNKPGSNEVLNECLETVAETVQRTQRIIDNVLRFARRESSEKELCSIDEIVRLSVATALPYAKSAGAEIRTSKKTELPQIHANAQAIEQVIVNLLINSIQAQSKTVEIEMELADDNVRLAIKDDGRGIGKHELERIFDPFFSSGDVSNGTGLGLAISYGIVNDHRGQIEVESELGIGTTFFISLPIAKLAE